MDIQNRYDELDNLISTIDNLLYKTESKDIKEDLEYIKYNYLNEKEELEDRLAELQEEEERQANYEYERSVL